MGRKKGGKADDNLDELQLVGLEHFYFSIIYIIIPSDFHIFQRGTVGQPPTR